MDRAIKRRERGEVNKSDISNTELLNEEELLTLLKSEIAVERSCAAIHLGKYKNSGVVTKLCDQLVVEKKLYSRIEICEVLTKFSDLSIDPLINLLGKIGKNQEKEIPETGFYKISYPLPRDIAARTICRFTGSAIKPLESFIKSSKDLHGIAQAIDCYGHIIFTNKINCSSSTLQKLYESHPGNNFLKYKIVRCLSGFKDEWSQSVLKEIIESNNEKLHLETLRSMLLLRMETGVNLRNNFNLEMKKIYSFFEKKL